MGWEEPAQGGCKEDLSSLSITCHAQGSTCCLNPYHHLYSREAISTSEKKEAAVSPGLPMPIVYQDRDLRTEINMVTHCFFPLAALWPNRSLQDVQGYGYQLPNSDGPHIVPQVLHPAATSEEKLWPMDNTVFGLGHQHTHIVPTPRGEPTFVSTEDTHL